MKTWTVGVISLLSMVMGALAMWSLGQYTASKAILVSHAGSSITATTPKVLYWYDPMNPQQHFNHPGKSPYMDMALVAKYADNSEKSSQGIAISGAQVQALGMRIGTVKQGILAKNLEATALVTYNDRDVSILQARTAGFIEHATPHAVGDLVHTGDILAWLRVPAWAAAQADDLTLRHRGLPELAAAAHQRLQQLGMSTTEIKALEHDGQVHDVVPLRALRSGVLMSVEIREGMTVEQGQTIARINGLQTIWLEAAIPQSQASAVHVGQYAKITIDGVTPENNCQGQVMEILPAVNDNSRTLTVRIQVDNPGYRLHPGMYAHVQLLQPQGIIHILVPSEAVLMTGTRSLVFLAEPDNRYQPVEVRVGAESSGMTEILQGLQPGDRIVLSGQFLVDSEASLENLPVRPLPGGSAVTSPASGMPPMEGM
ncbi:MAG: efflux RND transporter periplasmic adaptor subunit [Pseudomonadales bacterium]|nr:efflux RND transporter periplasmic adaptor subunit [Pseudomonadales bacterium]